MANQLQVKVGVLVEKDNKLLLIKERNNSDGNYYWNIIKGTFEPLLDVDLSKSAIRESKEEAGLEVKLTSILNIMHLRRKKGSILQVNYRAIPEKGVVEIAKAADQQNRKEDIREAKFLSKQEVKRIAKQEFIDERAFLAVRDWLKNKKGNLQLLEFPQK